MMLPTISGLVGAPFKTFALNSESTETFTAQEFTDGVFGGVALGGIAAAVRARMVVRKQLGESGIKKYKEGLIGGVL